MYIVARKVLRYPNDCKRIKEVMFDSGFELSLEDCDKIWSHYSESLCAGWLSLPKLDHELFEIVESYILKIEDR